jgi:hypothetical protein
MLRAPARRWCRSGCPWVGRCFAVLLAHPAQIVGETRVGRGLGEDGRQTLWCCERTRAWQWTECRTRRVVAE